MAEPRKITDALRCLQYSSVYFNISYILAVVALIYVYLKDKRVGIVVSVLFGFVLCFLPYTNGVFPTTMIKLTLIVFASFILFASLNYVCIQPAVNQILTFIVRLNFIVLIIASHNIFVIISLLFLTATTPIFTVKDGRVQMESAIIPKNMWVLFSTVVLIAFYALNPWFCNKLVISIFAVIIPCIAHFLNDTFLETRALSLFLLIIFDIFNNSTKSFNDLLRDSTY